jgi:hypothetical protein
MRLLISDTNWLLTCLANNQAADIIKAAQK